MNLKFNRVERIWSLTELKEFKLQQSWKNLKFNRDEWIYSRKELTALVELESGRAALVRQSTVSGTSSTVVSSFTKVPDASTFSDDLNPFIVDEISLESCVRK